MTRLDWSGWLISRCRCGFMVTTMPGGKHYLPALRQRRWLRSETAMTAWSRSRIREHNGLPSHWNFDGIPVGLIGYRGIDGTPLLLPRPAMCEWNRRRSVSSEEEMI